MYKRQELLQGKHDFNTSGSGGHTFKIALFTSSASLGAATTDYSTSNEISNTSGSAYSAGGKALTNTGVGLTSTTAFTDFFFFSSRRRHTRFALVSWARRCV